MILNSGQLSNRSNTHYQCMEEAKVCKTSYHGYVVLYSLETFHYPDSTLAALSSDAEAQKPVYGQWTQMFEHCALDRKYTYQIPHTY